MNVHVMDNHVFVSMGHVVEMSVWGCGQSFDWKTYDAGALNLSDDVRSALQSASDKITATGRFTCDFTILSG